MTRYDIIPGTLSAVVASLSFVFFIATGSAEPTANPQASVGKNDPKCDFFKGSLRTSAATSPGETILIGALGIKGEDAMFQQWNATFSTYLTETAGAALGGRAFRLQYLDFDAAYEAVASSCVDFVFVNPSMHACLESEYGVIPIRTLENFRNGHKLDRFHGTIFTRADRTDIQVLADLKGKIVEAVSISGLGACQLQWRELLANGIDFLNDPKQVRFSSNQQEIVKDVISGAAEVGMVRYTTSLGWRLVSRQECVSAVAVSCLYASL